VVHLRALGESVIEVGAARVGPGETQHADELLREYLTAFRRVRWALSPELRALRTRVSRDVGQPTAMEFHDDRDRPEAITSWRRPRVVGPL
jgi:hypothetical protein